MIDNAGAPKYEELYEDLFCVQGQRIWMDYGLIPVDVEETVSWVSENFPFFSPDERKAFRMRYVEDRTLADIGRELGDSTREYARQVLNHAKKKFLYDRNNKYHLILGNGIHMYDEICAEYERIRENQKDAFIQGLMKGDNDVKLFEQNRDLAECNFSARAYNCLMRAGLNTLEKIANVDSRACFLRIKQMGIHSVNEIERYFVENNLKAKWLS